MKFKGYTLNDFQVEAAAAIEAGKNVLLAAPTGSGKTLVAEYAIDRAVRTGRRAIYTSPIKALSNQKFRDFKGEGLPVGLMTGDLTLDPDAPVVIMTTEIFRNAVFEDPARFHDTDFAIFDEVHFVDDLERGTVWEESLIFAPPHVRFVGLSATRTSRSSAPGCARCAATSSRSSSTRAGPCRSRTACSTSMQACSSSRNARAPLRSTNVRSRATSGTVAGPAAANASAAAGATNASAHRAAASRSARGPT